MKISQVLAGTAAALALPLSAMDATWAKSGSNDLGLYWTALANWLVDGVQPTEPPTNVTDTVVFPHNGVRRRQSVYAGSGTTIGTMCGLSSASVTGDTSFEILNGGAWATGGVNARKPVTILNPNGFTGFWGAGDTAQIYAFPSSATFTPQVHNLDVQGRPTLQADGDGRVEVDALYNAGGLVKAGSAEVRIAGSMGGCNNLYVEEGDVTLPANADADTVENVMAGAYLHLDASDASTFEFQDGSGTSVTNWLDVRKDGRSAWLPHWVGIGADRVQQANPPFLSSEKSPTGLQYLDFGSCFKADTEPLYGPTNCCLEFAPVSNGAEVFCVFRYHEPFGMNALLGDYNLAPMQPYGGAIFGGSANENLATGHIYLDGKLVKGTDAPADGLADRVHVMSFGPATNLEVRTIGIDQRYSARCGGMLFGEILVFTNELSRVDRLRINDYLRRKWVIGGLEQKDLNLGSVVVRNAASQLKVDAGKRAKVLDVVTADDTLVKGGGGVLEVDTVHPANATLDIRGGSVALTRRVTPQLKLAADPLVRLDASADKTVVTEHDGTYDKEFVTAWKDCRTGVDISAVPFSSHARPHHPTVAAAQSPTGLDVVDFGNNGDTISSLTLPWYGQAARVYTGFIVMRQISSTYSFVPFFGCKDMCMERENTVDGQHARILSNTYPHPAAMSALWTVNGKTVVPNVYMPEYFGSGAGFVVVAFSARQPLAVDAIALGRDQATRAGGIQVGEYVLYDRELTEAERRNTEAYLMDKWLGSPHPAAAAVPTPSYRFAAGVDPVIDIDSDTTISSITGGTGDVIKRGDGNVVVASLVDASWKSVKVEAGGLSARIDAPSEEMAYHFDASDPDKYLDVYEEGGKQYVTKWKDVRDNGIVATNLRVPHSSGSWYNGGSGTVVQVTFPSGETRTGVDCGSFSSGSTGAGYGFSQGFTNIREGFTVWKNQNANWQCALFGSYPSVADYYRANDGLPFSSTSSSPNVRNGEIWVDGVETNNDVVLKDNLPHVLNVRTLANTTVNALSMIQCFGGGQVLFEQFALTEKLSPERRKYWQDYLTWKWFGAATDPEPVWTNAYFSTVSVAKGAALTLTGAADPIVDALDGAGTITANVLQGVAAISAEGEAVAAGDHLTVDGKVTFGDAVVVSLSGGGKVFDAPGDYTILEATGGLENVDLANWSCDTSVFSDLRSYTLKQVGNAIVLRVERKGAVLIVR